MSKKILIVGQSGSGKTYISAEMRKGGINAVDADLIPGLLGWFDKDGNEVEYSQDGGKEFFDNHELRWRKKVLKEYLDRQKEIYIFGISRNIFDVIDMFDKVYFLKLKQGLLARNLQYGNRQRADYEIENALKYAKAIEKKAKKLGVEIIDITGKSPEQIFEKIKR